MAEYILVKTLKMKFRKLRRKEKLNSQLSHPSTFSLRFIHQYLEFFKCGIVLYMLFCTLFSFFNISVHLEHFCISVNILL
jgi:hypothetical protein